MSVQLIIGSYEVAPTKTSPDEAQGMAGGFVYVGTFATDTTAADQVMQAALREDGYRVTDVDWIEAEAALETDDAEFHEEVRIIKEGLDDPAAGGVGYGIFYWFSEDQAG
jgi:hypothetical protein